MTTAEHKQHYQTEVSKIINYLERDSNDIPALNKIQQKLDNLANLYQNDERLGAARYKLYQAQAMLSFRLGNYDKSRRFIEESVALLGHSYETADQMLDYYNNSLESEFEKKSVAKWVSFIVAPFFLLLLVALVQLVAHFILNNSSRASSSYPPLVVLLNLSSVIVGALSVVFIILIPVWIIMIVRTNRYNSRHQHVPLSKTVAIVLSVFFGFWSWLYTYERDKNKFWVNFGLFIVTLTLWGAVAWIWSIIDAVGKPEEYFVNYPNYYES